MYIPHRRRWLAITLALAFTVSTALSVKPACAGDGSSALSRVTVQLPVFTRHFSNNSTFNNHNWGATVDIAMTGQWSVVGGYFINSYDRDTVFVGAGWYPIDFELSNIRFDLGGIAAIDLSGGYKPYNRADPLLGALSLKLGYAHVDDAGPLGRLGLAFTLIPAVSNRGTTALNLALTYRL